MMVRQLSRVRQYRVAGDKTHKSGQGRQNQRKSLLTDRPGCRVAAWRILSTPYQQVPDMADSTTPAAAPGAGSERRLDVTEFLKDKSPLKLVTGTQTSQGLTFNLEPGAIVSHPNSAVVFVCG